MPVPVASVALEEVRAPLAIVRRLLADKQTTTTSTVPDYFKVSLDGKWDQVQTEPPGHSPARPRAASCVSFCGMVACCVVWQRVVLAPASFATLS